MSYLRRWLVIIYTCFLMMLSNSIVWAATSSPIPQVVQVATPAALLVPGVSARVEPLPNTPETWLRKLLFRIRVFVDGVRATVRNMFLL